MTIPPPLESGRAIRYVSRNGTAGTKPTAASPAGTDPVNRTQSVREVVMTRALVAPAVVIVAIGAASAQEPLPSKEALIARAKSFELNTPYVQPPGDPLEHHTAG